MEDILASIRKIIAEDPPGSRALPEARTESAAPSVTERIFQHMGQPARSEPAKPAVTAEPYLRSSSMPSLSSTPTGRQSAETSKPFDIDAQMAEVLSKTRGGATLRDVEPSFDPVAPQVQAALDSLSNAPPPRPGFTVARDGFVPGATPAAPGGDPFEFSLGPSPFAVRSQPELETSMPDVRDTRFQDFGTFVPTRTYASETDTAEAPVSAPVAAMANEASAIDAVAAEIPAVTATESGAAVPAETASSEAPTPEAIAAQLKDFDAAIASPETEPDAALKSADKVLAELKSKLDQASALENETAPAIGEPEPAIASAAFAPVEAEEPVPELVLQEAPVELAREPEPEVIAGNVMAGINARTPFADIVSVFEPAPIAAPEMVREIVREPVREIVQEMEVAEPLRENHSANSVSPFHTMQVTAMQNAGGAGARSMEDTVAELLRPMLRSWLSENMPKIVERALRKEIDDSLHSEHKTAAE